MFYRILEMHASDIIGVAIFPSLGQSYINAIKKCVRIDGYSAVRKLFFRGLEETKKKIFQSPPHFSSVQQVFRRKKIQIDYFSNPNDKSCIERIKNLKIDVVFNNQPRYLKEDIIKAPRMCCLNRHSSILPKFRGVEPIFHALLNEEKEVGVTYHSMTLDIDAGDVYAQTTFPASSNVWDCYSQSFLTGAELFSKAIKQVEMQQTLFTIDPQLSRYYKMPTKEEIMRFRQMGLSYL